MNFLDMGFMEIVMILLVALLIFGPEKLPDIARKTGRIMNNLKKMSNDMTTQVRQEMEAATREESEPPPKEESPADTTDNRQEKE